MKKKVIEVEVSDGLGGTYIKKCKKIECLGCKEVAIVLLKSGECYCKECANKKEEELKEFVKNLNRYEDLESVKFGQFNRYSNTMSYKQCILSYSVKFPDELDGRIKTVEVWIESDIIFSKIYSKETRISMCNDLIEHGINNYIDICYQYKIENDTPANRLLKEAKEKLARMEEEKKNNT